VVIHYNSNKAQAEEGAEKLRKLGVKAVTVQADASSTTYGKDIVNATLAAFPGKTIDIVINNAGILTGAPGVKDYTAADFDTMLNTNTRSVFLLVQAVEPHMTSPGGRIVNVSSVVSRFGAAFGSFYAASKAALHVLSRGWAEEMGAKGINVNVALLGPFKTDMQLPEEAPVVHKFRVNQYLKRDGEVEEAAGPIVFLASPESSFITGQVINIDGGMTY
jgi:3-oxoacyl-[acyl-carrier protein] reductase